MKLGLVSNFQDEINNIESIWGLFKDVVDMWTVIDSGSTDGTQQKLKEFVGSKLKLIESDLIKTNGYGYSRTKLIELSDNMDWVLIIDGDERMLPEDIEKLKKLIDLNPPYDLIYLPRCHYRNWEMTEVEYGDFDKDPVIGSDWKEALRTHPDWQPKLIKRTMINGHSKIRFIRRIHELPEGVDAHLLDINSPVIRHFGWLKSDTRKKEIANLCTKLWQMDKENKEIFDTYVLENAAGTASASNPWNKPTD